MRTVLITGLIGSGKSALSASLREKGYPVYDSDSRTKALYDEIPGLKSEIETLLGVPFSQIGIIFSDERKRIALEELVYPLVKEDFLRFAGDSGAQTVFFESATAAGKKQFEDFFDLTVLVRSQQSLRFARNPKAEQRNHLQAEPEKTDYIIENNGTLQQLSEEADRMIQKLNL